MKKCRIPIIISLFVLIISYLFIVMYYLPRKTAENYLLARYGSTNKDNIEKKILIQKELINKSLENANFIFGDFEREKKMFKEKDVYVALNKISQKKVFFKNKYIHVICEVDFETQSHVDKDILKRTYYLLEFFIRQEGIISCEICYIKILDLQIQYLSKCEESDHAHNCKDHS